MGCICTCSPDKSTNSNNNFTSLLETSVNTFSQIAILILTILNNFELYKKSLHA